MRFAQIVIGPAGSGKSTYCATMQRHGENTRRRIDVVNLDPAAEAFDYTPLADIRELIHIDDAMEEMQFGPNGGLVFCMEFLMQNISWLEEELGDVDDDYIIFDCPGQIELYTHMDVMNNFIKILHSLDFRVCAVFLLDSHFMITNSLFISGAAAALSTMVSLEVQHVNVLSKIDKLNKEGRKQIERFLEPDVKDLCSDNSRTDSKWNKKYRKLTEAIAHVLDDYSLVKFCPLNIHNEESITDLLFIIDTSLQYADDRDVKAVDFEPAEEDDGFGDTDERFSTWSMQQGM